MKYLTVLPHKMKRVLPKRMISLAVAMLLSVFPMLPAFAAENSDAYVVPDMENYGRSYIDRDDYDYRPKSITLTIHHTETGYGYPFTPSDMTEARGETFTLEANKRTKVSLGQIYFISHDDDSSDLETMPSEGSVLAPDGDEYRAYTGSVYMTYTPEPIDDVRYLHYEMDLYLAQTNMTNENRRNLKVESIALERISPDSEPLYLVGDDGTYIYFELLSMDYSREKLSNINQVDNTQAKDTAGEDEGTDIDSTIVEGTDPDYWNDYDNDDFPWDFEDFPEPSFPSIDYPDYSDIAEHGAIGIAVGGAVVAAGGIGGALGKKSSSKKKSTSKSESTKKAPKKKSTYKMYVNKNFGDTLKKGEEPRYVYARIAEVPDGGAETRRDDLTQKIECFCIDNSLHVSDGGMTANGYKAARVEVPKDATKSRGAVTFSFRGEGGLYTRNVVFNIILGEPEISFPAETGDGYWDVNKCENTVQMIAGAGGSEKLRFVFMNVTREPNSIRFLGADGFRIVEQKDLRLAYTYYACIGNNTAPIDKESGLFADYKEQQITIEAEFDDNVIVRGVFIIELYPEGLFIFKTVGDNPVVPKSSGMRKVLKNGYVEIWSYATREKDELTLDPLIPSTYFNPCYAVVGQNGKAAIYTEPKYFSFEKMKTEDENTKPVILKYEYNLEWYINGFSITPADSIPEMKQKYFAVLPMSVKAEGKSDKVEIPVRLLGEPFENPKGWNEEYVALCKTIIRYFPGDIAHQRVQYVKEHFSDPSLYDRSELRMMRYDVIRAAQNYWLSVYNAEIKLIDYYDTAEMIFKKPPRFIADVAFSIWAKYQFGQNEAIITPFKDFVVDCLDEAIWNYAFTGRLDVDYQEKINEQAVNLFENAIDMDDASASLNPEAYKKLLPVLVAYILMDWYKNYAEMEPKDFWESWRTTCFDITGMALKKLVGAGLEKAMKSKYVNQFFDSKFMNKLNEYLPGVCKGKFYKPGYKGMKEFTSLGNVDLSLVRVDEVWWATHIPTGKKAFILLDGMSYVGYREIVQSYMEAFFGVGISWLTENSDEYLKDDDNNWRGIRFVVKPQWFGLDDDYEELLVNLDIVKFFESENGLASEGFLYIYELLYGPFVKYFCTFTGNKEAIMDPGKALLGLDS